LVDKIATGGMAEIFRAKTFSFGGFESLLVIKRILPELGVRPEFVDMFIDEARVAVALQHPNITRVFDFGKVGDDFYIAMECVAGKDVLQLMKALAHRRERMPMPFVAFVAMEVCRALSHAHSRRDLDGNPLGIVHRDVSPGNVLVSYEGQVKLADFGIARAVFASAPEIGLLKGKYEYMSPEQASGQPVDHRSDIFCAGVVLWEMLTGRRAFRTATEEETLDRVRGARLPSPAKVNPAVPAALDVICLRALCRDPSQRYADAGQMYAELRAFLEPHTSEQVRVELTRFMGEVFREEMARERASLQSGTSAALVWKQGGWDEPDVETLPGWSQAILVDQVRAIPGVAAVGLAALVVLLLLFALSKLTPPQSLPVPEVVPVEVVPAVPSQIPSSPVAEEELARVRFHSEPAGATVYLNGEEVGRTPLHYRRAPVGRAMEAELHLVGYANVGWTIGALAANEDLTYRHTLVPVAVIPGSLTVSGPQGSRVFVDGEELGVAPLSRPVNEGVHQVRVVRADGSVWEERVKVEPGVEVQVEVGE